MRPMSSDLSHAVQRLYVVFGKYGLHAPVAGCEHCVMPEDIARIQAKPLRQLSDEDLRKYATKALTTWGDENHFKHFLPRLFELMTESDWMGFEALVLFSKLPYGGWTQWPENEQQALKDFMFCFWRDALAGADEAKESLTCLAQAKITLQPFLDYWRSGSGDTGMVKLVEYGNDVLGDLTNHGIIKTAWWDGFEHRNQVAEVTQWLLSEQTLLRLEEFAVTHAGEEGSENAMDLAGYLRALRT